MNIDDISIDRLVPIYLMSSYLYYKKDTSVLSDDQFDMLCKRMLDNWSKIKHRHKRLIKKHDLEAGTGYAIKKYPTIVMSAAERWKDGEFNGD